jgi:ComF family protein
VQSAFQHGGAIADAISQLKYSGKSWLAAPLARLVYSDVSPAIARPFCVAPVPLHRKRLAERGFNQAALLGRHLARHYRVPFLPRALLRIRDTPSQVGQNRRERLSALEHAFIGRRRLQGRRVLLVDDVITTGTTLDQCARAALEAGASEVYGLTITCRA